MGLRLSGKTYGNGELMLTFDVFEFASVRSPADLTRLPEGVGSIGFLRK